MSEAEKPERAAERKEASQAPLPLLLDGASLTIEDVRTVAIEGRPVAIAPSALQRLRDSRRLVFELAEQDTPIYGFNRGVGWNKDREVDRSSFSAFNRNLLLSHCAGVRPEASEEETRAVLLARLNGLLLGYTGVQPEIAIRYAEFLNYGIHPIVPLRGSVGAADITLLSHIGLAIIGEGEVIVRGERKPAAAALAEAGLVPLELGPKDGLAIVSSNALASGLGALGLAECLEAVELAELASALSLEALQGNVSPLDPAAHLARPYEGQLASLQAIRVALEGSGLWEKRQTDSLQDPLSFRDACQIHGAARDSLAYTERLLLTQLNSSDDNPCLLYEEKRIVSCANFDPLVWTLGFEMLGSAMHHVSRSSAYRTLKLGNPSFTGLTRYLTPDEQRYIGFGTVQKTVSSLDAEIRHLSNPVSADYMSLAGDIEDHGTNAPLVVSKTRAIADRVLYTLAIEMLHAAQAIDLRGEARLGRGTEAAYRTIRSAVPYLSDDRELTGDIEAAYRLLADGTLLREVKKKAAPAIKPSISSHP